MRQTNRNEIGLGRLKGTLAKRAGIRKADDNPVCPECQNRMTPQDLKEGVCRVCDGILPPPVKTENQPEE